MASLLSIRRCVTIRQGYILPSPEFLILHVPLSSYSDTPLGAECFRTGEAAILVYPATKNLILPIYKTYDLALVQVD